MKNWANKKVWLILGSDPWNTASPRESRKLGKDGVMFKFFLLGEFPGADWSRVTIALDSVQSGGTCPIYRTMIFHEMARSLL